MLSNRYIPTEEIFNDIAETQSEIDDFNDIKTVMMKRPQDNRTKIYLLEGKISKRVGFINKLNQILNYRTKSQY